MSALFPGPDASPPGPPRYTSKTTLIIIIPPPPSPFLAPSPTHHHHPNPHPCPRFHLISHYSPEPPALCETEGKRFPMYILRGS
ncbi:hypothetical protein MARPO_0127s0043 [Marchantia polymorpha]|uniref:Uncharacterized protein n=1 Tax=Marchantia polymorpha TaxID=3197 RepID=A0A2R6W8T5_MARPO|nr:hypothetical protein MARPO_0127s0043 [Marchantia polymorpha]|eukprot:PTQ30261.1 hypothetical protein MARPO_0127s0043 [Marchantia polymorpha]